MAFTQKPMRYAHSDGHTDLCYDDDGSHLLTCGTDGDVRIWAGLEDDDAVSHRAGDKVYCIAFKDGRFFTASEDNAIRAHTFEDGNPDGMITRFTAPVTHMCFNRDGKKLLAGACDFAVKYVTVEDCSHVLFHGHEAPILSVALDPEEDLVATSSCDGTVRIWKITDQSCAKTLNLLSKCNDVSFSKTLCRLSWHPNKGKYLAIPVKTEIQMYDRATLEHSYSLTDESIKEDLSIVDFSPCGKYVAASCVNGAVFIWNFNSKQCIQRQGHVKGLKICALKWNPKGNNEIAFCDTEGQLGMMENVIPENDTSAKDTVAELKNKYSDLFEDDEDDDMLVQASNQPKTNDSDDDDDDMPAIKVRKRPFALDNEDSMDVDSVSKMSESDVLDELDKEDPMPAPYQSAPKPVIVKGFEPTPMQPAFQPSSTPVHLAHRFMVWNAVGAIRQYNTEEENSIDIEFHDTSTHHAMHVNNTLNHTMADISSQAVVLACKSDDDVPSKLVCMHFNSWDGNTEWTVPMPDGEDITAISVSDEWLAIATDKRNIRLFSIGGVQRDLFSIPGPVVTMVAHTNQLLIIYHRGMGIPGDQNLGVHLVQVTDKKKFVMNGQNLPISPKSTLAWTGFSAEGSVFTYDSCGILRLLNRGFGYSWVEVANTRKHSKGKSDHHWIVGIRENPQQLRCIPCKGSRYPATLPRPAVSLLPFQIPLCELSTDKGQMEETFWRTHLFSRHFDFWTTQGYEFDETERKRISMPEQESLMKLFALACKTDREFRAVELCDMMPNSHTMQLAIKYASRLKRLTLAQRISELARARAEEERSRIHQEQEECEEEEADYSASMQAGYSRVQTEWSQKRMTQQKETLHQEDQDDEEEEDEPADDATPKSSGPMLQVRRKSEASTPTTSLPSSQTRVNPFKVGAQVEKHSATTARGSSVFDKLKVKSVTQNKSSNGSTEIKPARVKSFSNKSSTQPKLFASKNTSVAESEASENTPLPETKKAKTGFQLWKEENLEELAAEHPDLSEADLTVAAARAFKQLTKDEQKKWSDKAKNVSNQDDSDSKKRKRDDENAKQSDAKGSTKSKDVDAGNANKKKKPLSQSTNSKLAGFAFDKKDD